jgi:hypothetical protein
MVTRDLSPIQRVRLAWALAAAEHGWHVFPLHPGSKHPSINRWEQRATTNPDRITSFWTQSPEHNTAIATGPSGLVVVDLDMAGADHASSAGLSMWGASESVTSGAQVLAVLASEVGAGVPETHTVATPSGGTHLYYRHPPGLDRELRSTAGTIGPLVDSRAHGGYVVAPGSLTERGAYELIDDRDPLMLPAWLVAAQAPRPAPVSTRAAEVTAERLGSYVAAAVRAQVDRVRGSAPRAHNKTVFVAACRLGELVAAGALDPDLAHHLLKDAAWSIITGDCDCTEREIDNTITSGLRTGALRPRANLPGRRPAA